MQSQIFVLTVNTLRMMLGLEIVTDAARIFGSKGKLMLANICAFES